MRNSISRLTSMAAALALAGVTLFGVSGASAATSKTPKPDLPTYKIAIVPGSTINLVSRESKLPISIRNDYDAEIRVQVHVSPGNLNVLIPANVEVTVPANTTFVAQVPVTAIADGPVKLKAWLTTFSGLRMGKSVEINMNVRAEIEDSLILSFILFV
ncbi:MAG: DUF6049 family protein, partial [Micrococcales bacterium]